MSSEMLSLIGVLGTGLSLLGVVIALWQIRKTRSAAEAAAEAARDARGALSQNLLLSDLTACATNLEEVKVLIRKHSPEAALLRVTDISRALLHAQAARRVDGGGPAEFKKILIQLSVLRDLLERNLQGDAQLNPVQVNTTLSQISDLLNSKIGRMKFHPLEIDHRDQ